MKYRGKDFILQVDDDGDWVSHLADRSTVFSLNNEPVDTSAKGDSQWRVLSPYGVRSGEISCSGLVTDGRAYDLILAAAFNGYSILARIIHGESQAEVISGRWIASIDNNGEYNGAHGYGVKLSNSGVASMGPPPPFLYDQYVWTATWDGDEWIITGPVVTQTNDASVGEWVGDDEVMIWTETVPLGDPAPDEPAAPPDPITQVATPVISPPGGATTDADPITITCATALADTYYTLDGSTPDNTKTLYVSPFTLPPDVASLVDPADWIGAWDFDSGTGASAITGLQDLDTANAGTSLSPIAAQKLHTLPFALSYNTRRTASAIAVPVTVVSFAGFFFVPTDAHLVNTIYVGLSTDTNSPILRVTSDGRIQNGSNFTAYSVPLDVEFHIALTYDGTEARLYLDGVLTYTATMSLGGGSQHPLFFGNPDTGSTGTSDLTLDNFVVHRSVFSQDAIDFLAAGGMPAADGTLGATGPTTVKAIGIKAGMTDSAIASETYTVTHQIPSFLMWGPVQALSYDETYAPITTFPGMATYGGVSAKVHPVSGKLILASGDGDVWAMDPTTRTVYSCQSGTQANGSPASGVVGSRMVLQFSGSPQIGSDKLGRSDDGTTWTAYNGPYAGGSGYGSSVCASTFQFLHCGQTATSTPALSKSSDAVTWTALTLPSDPSSGSCGAIAANGDDVVVLGTNSTGMRVHYSHDGGNTWADANINGLTADLYTTVLFACPTGFYSYGAGGWRHSPRGDVWSALQVQAGFSYLMGVHDGGVFASATAGAIWYSENGAPFAPAGFTNTTEYFSADF